MRPVNWPYYTELQRRSALALDELGAAARALKQGQTQVAHVDGAPDACHQVITDALASVYAAVEHLRGTAYFTNV